MSNHVMNCAWRTHYLPCDCGYRDVRSTVGQRVKRGMIQDVLVTYDKDGKSTVTPTSDWRAITAEDRAKWSEKVRNAT